MAIQPLDLSPYPEDLRLDFYGALFAMSAADRDQDASEDDRIFASLDLGALSEDARKRVFQLAISPPPLERSLLAFKQADADLRHALLFNLIDVVLADGSIEPAEHVGLHQAREVLGVSRDEMAHLHDLAFEAQQTDHLLRPIRPASEA